jgi:hypothetical protein
MAKQISNCDFPDTWAENWERFVADESWCLAQCVYCEECGVVGYPDAKCSYFLDQENSR